MRILTIEKVKEDVKKNQRRSVNAQEYYNSSNFENPLTRDGLRKPRNRDEQFVLDRFKLK